MTMPTAHPVPETAARLGAFFRYFRRRHFVKAERGH